MGTIGPEHGLFMAGCLLMPNIFYMTHREEILSGLDFMSMDIREWM